MTKLFAILACVSSLYTQGVAAADSELTRANPAAYLIVDVPGQPLAWVFSYSATENAFDSAKLIETATGLPVATETADSKTLGNALSHGSDLAQSKGCLACHSTNGSRSMGPTYKGLYMKKETVITGGHERQVVADDAYLKTSIKDPQADVVKGYPAMMPKVNLTEQEVSDLVDYIKSLQ